MLIALKATGQTTYQDTERQSRIVHAFEQQARALEAADQALYACDTALNVCLVVNDSLQAQVITISAAAAARKEESKEYKQDAEELTDKNNKLKDGNTFWKSVSGGLAVVVILLLL